MKKERNKKMNNINPTMGGYPTTPPKTPPIQPLHQTPSYQQSPYPQQQPQVQPQVQQQVQMQQQPQVQQPYGRPTQQPQVQQPYGNPTQQPNYSGNGTSYSASSTAGTQGTAGKQIMKIDGKDVFVEIMDTKFKEGKVTFQFSNYDKSKPKGQRQKDFIRFNLTFEEFMNLGHDVLYGNMMNWQPIDNYNNLRPAYMKGTPSKYNNGVAIARRLEIKNGDKQPIRLICSEGQGKETGNGLIQMVGQAEKRVQVGMSQEAFRSIFLVVPMYIQAYLSNHYQSCVQ